MRPRALITGISGFTGRYLAGELRSAGFEVYGISEGREADATICSVDLRDFEGLGRCVRYIQPTVVAHLAAISFVAHGNAAEIYHTNLIGTRNLLESLATLKSPPHAVLLASSSNIYGNVLVDYLDESVAPHPANDYAVSKLAMEYMANIWANKLPIIIVRPFNYTGVGQSLNFLLPKIVDHFRRGLREIELGNLDVARDFSDVRMVAKVYARLLQLAPAGEVFNVCSGTAYTLTAMLDMMAKIAGYTISVVTNPAFVRENEVKILRGSNAKLLKLLDNIEQIPLRETLEWMYREGAGLASGN